MESFILEAEQHNARSIILQVEIVIRGIWASDSNLLSFSGEGSRAFRNKQGNVKEMIIRKGSILIKT